MGGSIGPSGSGISSGSLGGYLQLQQQNSDAWDDGAYLLSCVGRGGEGGVQGMPKCGRQLWPQCACRFQVPGVRLKSCQVASAVIPLQQRRTPAKEGLQQRKDSSKGGL